MADEKWKDVEGFECLQVSTLGRVRTQNSIRRSIRNGKENLQRKQGVILSPWLGKNGYLHVAPKIGQRREKLLVHRLVAKAFVRGWFVDATVNHIDGVKTNNMPKNLEWITLSENTKKQWETGLVDLRGKNNKLLSHEVLKIRASGKPARFLADKFGVSISTIHLIKKGLRWAWL